MALSRRWLLIAGTVLVAALVIVPVIMVAAMGGPR
jgi:hypothetical protein